MIAAMHAAQPALSICRPCALAGRPHLVLRPPVARGGGGAGHGAARRDRATGVGASWLRLPAGDQSTAAQRLGRQPQAGAAGDAAGGALVPTRTPIRRHHRLGARPAHYPNLLADAPSPDRTRADSPLGLRGAVRQRRLRLTADGGRRPDQHGGGGNPYENAKARASSRRSNARRCTSTIARRSMRPRPTRPASSPTSKTPSGCTRTSVTGRRSNSRRSTPQQVGVDFAGGSLSRVHSIGACFGARPLVVPNEDC